MLDAVAKYDIDGVHFDDYFYPYPEAGQDFPRRGELRHVRRGLRQHGRLAPGQRQHADPGDEPADQGDQAVGEVRHQPVRHLAQQPHRPDRLGAPAGCRATTTSTPTPGRGSSRSWIDYIVPQLYWHIGFDAGRLRQAGAVVGGRRSRHRRCSSTSPRPTTGSASGGVERSGRARPAAGAQPPVRGRAAACTSAPRACGPTRSARSPVTPQPTTPGRR